MSINVNELTKYYDTQKVVNNISFQVKKGEIVGFLGPNGAGKSTTMKILTGYLPPTLGTVSICGFDVVKQTNEIKKHIGYLPEHNPLYPDMYIKEYLHFIAGIHGLKQASNSVNSTIEQVGLGPESKKKIGQLSKGYRQRVGLAQAMIHKPEVLILDEPTSGLDPNQIAEIRQVIKDIGAERTVLLSTHIMQEVEAICNRIVIINKGELVANNTIDNLKSNKENKPRAFIVEFKEPIIKEHLQEIPHVIIQSLENNHWKITSVQGNDVRPMLFTFAVKHKLTLLSMQEQSETMEDVFKDLTQK